jgi:hypothetical protein
VSVEGDGGALQEDALEEEEDEDDLTLAERIARLQR